jgi:hypothetical protein
MPRCRKGDTMTLKQPKGPPRKGQEQGPPPDHDPVIEARVERAAAPYAELLEPEDLEFMKLMLRLYLASHPEVAPMVDRLRHRPDAASGPRPSPGAAPVSEAPPARKARPGSR